MNILLIGGSGFIGTHIVERLDTKQHKITVFNRSKNRFAEELEDVNYIYGNFDNVDAIKKALKGIDIVYHLLSTTVPSTANENPLFDVQSNLLGTIKLLEALEGTTVKRIVFSSSGGTVYGNPEYTPIDEKHPLHPIGSYGITKVAIESYIQLYAKKLNLSYMIIRPSNPYGPRQGFGGVQGVVSNFLYKAVLGEELTVWGDGKAIRDYIYISDVADFFINAGLSEKQGIFNLGSGQGYSVNEIIETIEHVVGVKTTIRNIELHSFNVKEVVLNVDLAKSSFNWKPTTSLLDGVRLHYDWIKGELDDH
ncbi:NAD-dependent epimerase/dehydratase family protein [Patescibacteria group bacterium]|nr:NAD-dependent epimerase/dehydratase family protein [Patescibacteria group bacterium]